MALSPMMQHYLQKKEEYKDSLLFYRLGDFYEMFFDDAITASKALDLTLTGRDCGLADRAPMCGVPYHAVNGYIAKLIDQGYKVAICEQITEPNGKTLVERDVIRVITAGTLIEDGLLDERKNNFIISAYSGEQSLGLAWADISTGEFYISEEKNLDELNGALLRINPSEIIANDEMFLKSYDLPAVKTASVPKFSNFYNWSYEYNQAYKVLKTQLKVHSLTVFDCEDSTNAICAAGALIEYLNQTQKRSLSHINRINLVRDDSFMYLDNISRTNLEITETLRDKKRRGSLLWLIDQTETSMGARKLRSYLMQPLAKREDINYRLSGVEELTKKTLLRESVKQLLSKVSDIERLSGKIAYGNVNPRDCIALKNSLEILPNLKSVLENFDSQIFCEINSNILDFSETVNLISSAINDDPPALLKDGGYIKAGYSNELDEIKSASTDGKNWIVALENEERTQTGIKNLKISYNRIFGYYIEVLNSQRELVPYRYQRKQTVANAERYITQELKAMEEKILGAEEKSLKLELQLFEDLRAKLLQKVSDLQITASQIALLDTLYSFATVSVKNNYVRPIMTAENIKIVNGRHAVVEALLKDEQFVPNDTELNNTDNRIMVITGPNMAGKSTYMRQVALIVLMAHIGCFVPADYAEIALTDRIFTRVGASDNLAFGQSTFMVEMTEVANILHNATSKSLLILDEIGRGTSTLDGLSIAWAVIDYVAKHINAKTLFATHYHELTELEGMLDGVKNYRINVKDLGGTIAFLRKIVRGGTNKSFGIEVAALAGLPNEVILNAKKILQKIESSDIVSNFSLNSLKENTVTNDNKNSKKSCEIEVLNMLKEININALTPFDAMVIVADLQHKLNKE
ncbi:MAG: DNA mismatch repair protein MutS [Clostridia bacterium]|jgi:DNA mismatch repair protein MutS|nr:DNA mismatch repair protein MutS [Clostridia bacterium]